MAVDITRPEHMAKTEQHKPRASVALRTGFTAAERRIVEAITAITKANGTDVATMSDIILTTGINMPKLRKGMEGLVNDRLITTETLSMGDSVKIRVAKLTAPQVYASALQMFEDADRAVRAGGSSSDTMAFRL